MKSIELLKNIKFIISDFDGIFTDGCVYIDSNGNESKKISYKDVMAVSKWIKAGYKLAIVSGEESSAIEYFRKKFDITEIYQKIRNKKEVVLELLKKYNLDNNEVLYIGDDVNDIESMKLLKNIFTVKNAHKKVKELDNIRILEISGGDGAFRELIDTLLEIKNV